MRHSGAVSIRLSALLLIPLLLPGCAPEVRILLPRDGDRCLLGARVFFAGQVSDINQSVFASSALGWRSDLDGALGNGREIFVDTLSPGSHRVTFRAIDADNNAAAATVQVNVLNQARMYAIDLDPQTTITGFQSIRLGVRALQRNAPNRMISWQSHLSGDVGYGPSLMVPASRLGVGTHIITMRENGSVSDTVMVTVR